MEPDIDETTANSGAASSEMKNEIQQLNEALAAREERIELLEGLLKQYGIEY